MRAEIGRHFFQRAAQAYTITGREIALMAGWVAGAWDRRA